jgi:cytochrome c peroxidase
MHNGAFFTLEEVVDFYNEGGGESDLLNTKTKILKPLNLTDDEKADLVEFLGSMSGEEIKLPFPKIPPIAAFDDWQPKK